MKTYIWVNLLPDGTGPLPEPMLTYQKVSYGIHLRTSSQVVLMNLIRNMCSEITHLEWQPHTLGANE